MDRGPWWATVHRVTKSWTLWHVQEEMNKDLFLLARSHCWYFGYFLVFPLEILAYLQMQFFFKLKL